MAFDLIRKNPDQSQWYQGNSEDAVVEGEVKICLSRKK